MVPSLKIQHGAHMSHCIVRSISDDRVLLARLSARLYYECWIQIRARHTTDHNNNMHTSAIWTDKQHRVHINMSTKMGVTQSVGQRQEAECQDTIRYHVRIRELVILVSCPAAHSTVVVLQVHAFNTRRHLALVFCPPPSR